MTSGEVSRSHPAVVSPPQLEELDAVRSQVVDAAIYVLAIFGSLGVAASLYRAVELGWQWNRFLHIGAYLVVLGIAIFRQRLSFRLRAYIMVGILFLVGVTGLLTWGLVGMGVPVLITSSIAAAVFLGAWSGVLVIAASMAVMVGIGVGVHTGQTAFDLDVYAYVTTASSWFVAAVASGLFASMVVASLAKLHGSLSGSIAALRDSEERFRAIFNQTYQFIGLLSPEGTLLAANRTALDFAGLDESQVVGRPFWDTHWWQHSAEQQERVRRAVQEAAAGGFVRFDTTHPDQNGQLHVVDFSLKPVKNAKGDVVSLIPEARDITEIRRAEEGLRQGEEQFRLIAENLADLVAVLDLEGRRLYNSPSYKPILGDPETLRGSLSFAEIHPEDRRRVERVFQETVKTGVGQRLEYRLVSRDGHVHHIESQGSVIRDARDEVSKVVVVSRDITERKRAEEAYRSLVDHSLQGLMIMQGERIAFANQAFCEMSGYTLDELRALSPDQAQARIHPEDRAAVWQRYLDRLQGKDVTDRYQFRMIRKDGSVFWAEAYSSLVTYQDRQATQLAFIDITDRKEAEQELRESEERFRSLTNASLEGIAITEQGRVVDANPGFIRLLGYSLDELVGTDVQMLVAPEDRDMVVARIRSGYEEPYEHKALQKDGSIIDVEVCGRAVPYKGRECRVTALRDITERKRAEEALQESEGRFRQLAENVPEVFWLVSPDWKDVLYVSPAYEEVWGRPCEELYEHPLSWLDAVVAEDREGLTAVIDARVSADTSPAVFPESGSCARTARSAGSRPAGSRS